MPTERKVFRDDIHLGHKVPTVDTDDLVNGCVTEEKLADNSVSTRTIQDEAVTTPKIADDAVTTPKIKDDAVTTPKIADKAVTPVKVSDDFQDAVVKPLVDSLRNNDIRMLKAKDTDLQNQIDSLEISGIALSNVFGSDPHIGISQKTLTEAFDRLYAILENITGEVYRGISMVVTPEYYIGEEGCNVHVTATTVDTNGIFEKIEFYINGELVSESENTDYVEFDTEISETSVVMCKAKILGVEYTEQKVITHYSSFFLGGGTSFHDIMDVEHVIPIRKYMRGAYDVACAEGDHIIIVVGETLADSFIRADINGVEIPFNKYGTMVDGKLYKVFVSESTYSAGIYNVDING